MNILEFKNYYRELNLTREEDDWIFVEHYPGEHKINFLQEFIDILWESWDMYLQVDEGIWFINNTECVYIWREFLDFCKSKRLKGDKAMTLYYDNLDRNTEIKDCDKYESYKDTYKRTKK